MSIEIVEVFLKFRIYRVLIKSSIIIIDAVSKYWLLTTSPRQKNRSFNEQFCSNYFSLTVPPKTLKIYQYDYKLYLPNNEVEKEKFIKVGMKSKRTTTKPTSPKSLSFCSTNNSKVFTAQLKNTAWIRSNVFSKWLGRNIRGQKERLTQQLSNWSSKWTSSSDWPTT